ncbi:abortive infection system antitoxin AbiGi family protein [Pseudomonas sp. yb_1]|uniref:abortive infection system antitoxin AbiGi family protein n=1 Tax=Pseudomonas sp. yb_1 TaxID=3367217 RepID=UPI00370CDE4C
MQPRSVSLFHFTKSLEILKSVLKNGFWPRYCLEDVEWQGREENDFIAFPMVCFCDIPMSRISEHVNFYGSFGLGLTKEWGAKNNLNPVFYFSGDNPLHGALKSLTRTISGLEGAQNKKGLMDIRYILAHSKPTKGRMIIGGEPVIKDFYQESEWRYVPQKKGVKDYLRSEDFSDKSKLDNLNSITQEKCMLEFLPSDVKYIFVPTDSEIPAIMNFIQTELDSFPSADLKLLMSRVTSLESLSLDT